MATAVGAVGPAVGAVGPAVGAVGAVVEEDFAAEEAALGVPEEEKKCVICCGIFPLSSFAVSKRKDSKDGHVVKCDPCREKARLDNEKRNKTPEAKAAKAAFKKSEAGKEANKRYAQGEAGKEANKRYAQGEAGKAAKKRAKHSDAGKATEKRYAQGDAGKAAKKRAKRSDAGRAAVKRAKRSEAGKAANKRAKRSEAGKAAVKRGTARRKARQNADPHLNMINRLVCAAGGLASGRRKKSPTFVERTSFQSVKEFCKHVASTFAEDEEGTEMTWDNYADTWEVEHRIPKEAYDHTNPIDIKRCWSAANMRALAPKANKEKGIQILRDEADVVGVDHWPLKWNGQFPSKEFIDAFYAENKALKDLPVEEEEDDEGEWDDEAEEELSDESGSEDEVEDEVESDDE